jgi:membrane-associated phospholipid phosphatase
MRVSEWIVLVFFAWTTALAVALPISGAMRARVLVTNFLVWVLYGFLVRVPRQPWVEIARDWVPQALMILAYKQMGWFAPATHTNQLEHQWIVWDRLLLDELGGRAFIESAGPVLPFLLELSYALVYAIPPITMGIVYAVGMRKRADTLLSIYLLGLFLCYAQFPFWPSEPPRAVFSGQDLPNVTTVLRTFNLWLVGNYGIHTSVFPSAHVSGAFAGAFGIAYLIPGRRWIVVAYFAYGIFVAVATVYGRYHYAVDAVAGFVVGVVAFPLGAWLVSFVDRRRMRNEARLAHRLNVSVEDAAAKKIQVFPSTSE